MEAPDPGLCVVADGLYFGESPRWRDGRLYVSDMTGRKIYTIDSSGRQEVLIEVEKQPNGMCFTDDGTLIYSSMFDGQLHQFKDGTSRPYADLSSVMTGYCGDMVIDNAGRVYVDDTGARVLHGEKPSHGRLLLVDTDTSVRIVAEDLVFPNGIGIDNSGKNLYVAETFAGKLNRFEISEDGTLKNRAAVWDVEQLPLPDGRQRTRFCTIDGLCIDSEDGIWLSMLDFNAFVRRDAKGNITHKIRVDGDATACTLGGDDGKTLFLVVNKVPVGKDLFDAMVSLDTRSTIYSVRVDFGRGRAMP